jgi:hypothetical protein
VKKLMLASAVLALAGCQTASATYQAPDGPDQVGYFNAPVDDGRLAVTYTGTKGMAPAQVAEYAMWRAAELTIASGKEWFAVLQTSRQQVRVGDVIRIDGRSGSVLTGETTTATAGGGGDRSSATSGVDDGVVPGGPTTGGFGGGDVPYQVLERWRPPTVNQATLIIQLGSGNETTLEGLERTPEFFSAQEVAASIRAKMAS